MERARARGIVFVALCGAMMVLLSFGSWVHFHTIQYEETGGEAINPVSLELRGTETSRARDREELLRGDVKEEDGWCSCRVSVGDGYLTAGLGAFIVFLAALAFATQRDRLFPLAIIGSSVLSLFLAANNATAEWQAIVWTSSAQTEFVQGNTEPALWALVATSVVTALLGAGLWVIARLKEQDEEWDDADADDEAPEMVNSWV